MKVIKVCLLCLLVGCLFVYPWTPNKPVGKTVKAAVSYSYNRDDAVNFAVSYCKKICPDNYYQSHDADCAHFVSYALMKGGIGMPGPLQSSCRITYNGFTSSRALVNYLVDLKMARLLSYQETPNGLSQDGSNPNINIPSGFEKGDIVWYRYPTNGMIDNASSHITIYIGDNKVAEHSYGNSFSITGHTCGNYEVGFGGIRYVGTYFNKEVCRVEFWKLLNSQVTPPSIPTLKSPSNGVIVSLTPRLEWYPVINASSYRLQISDDPKWETLIINEPNITTTYFDVPSGKLKPGVEYYWHVKAVNQSESAFTSDWHFTTSSSPPPTSCTDPFEPNDTFSTASTAFTSRTSISGKICSSTDKDYFKIDVASSGTINLNLTVPSNKDYELYLYNSSYSEVKKSTNGTSQNETIAYNVTSPGIYYIKVEGYNGSYDVNNGYVLSGSWPVTAQTLGQVQLSSPSNGDTLPPGSIWFYWNSVTNATKYEFVLYNGQGQEAYRNIFTTTTCGLQLGKEEMVTWKVRAGDNNGNWGPWSSTWSLTIKSGGAPPGSFTLTATPECNGTVPQIRLNWTAASGANIYRIYRNGTELNSVTGTQFINTSVTAGTTYSYYIRAENIYGYSFSNEVSATAPSNCSGGIYVGGRVRTTATVNVRSGAGLSYSVIVTLPANVYGDTIGGPISADGYRWWCCRWSYNGNTYTGWSVENYLTAYP